MQSNITFATKLSPPCAGTALQTGSKEAQGLACLADIAVMRKWSDEASEHESAFEDLLARFNVQHQRQALLTGVGTQSWPNWSPRGPKGPVSLGTIKLAVARVREREMLRQRARRRARETIPCVPANEFLHSLLFVHNGRTRRGRAHRCSPGNKTTRESQTARKL